MRRADSLEKTLMLGKMEGRRRRGRQRMRWLDGITDTMDMGLGAADGHGAGHVGAVAALEAAEVHGHEVARLDLRVGRNAVRQIGRAHV